MALSNFISKLNWRLMVVHFIACWFIYHAITQLGYLYDYKFLEFMINHKFEDEIDKFYKGENVGLRLSMDLVYAAYAGLVAILLAFVISLIISIKHKWFWLNSLIVFLAGLGSFLVDRFYWNHVKRFFMFPGIPFRSDWWFNFIGGTFMVAVGLSLFFWKRIIRFIDGRRLQPDEQGGYSAAIQQ
jgi:hypothetical protein